jgi:phosphonate transport system substrate-binding protein
MIKKITAFLFACIALCAVNFAHANDSILIGIAPHSSARIILESHSSLRSFLETRFGKPVEIVTAPNFSEFTRRSLQGQYDLLITSPHLALIAQEHASYTPIMTYTQGLETVLVSLNETLSEKRPLTIWGLDPVSFVTLTGLEELKQRGLIAEKNANVSYASASDSTALAVIQGKADVAIMSWPNYTKLNDEIKKQVAVSWRSKPEPSRIYLIKPSKGIDAQAWQQAIDAFTTSPEGIAHLENNKLKAFRKFHADELNSVRPLADATLTYLNRTASTENGK